MSKDVKRPIGNGYYVRAQWLPYELSDREQQEMKAVFAAVMAPLAFRAAPHFVENLFSTSILLRVYDAHDRLAAFGNIRIRESAGVTVRHVFAVYVAPQHRGNDLSVRAVEVALLQETMSNSLCVRRPLYVTGSAVNPIVVRSLAKRADLWPDLLRAKPPPPQVLAIARDSARYYPAPGEFEFQVGITPEYALLDPDGITPHSDDPEFDRRFYKIARPVERKLLLFVARIRLRHVAAAAARQISMRFLSRTPRRGSASQPSRGDSASIEPQYARSRDAE